MFAGLFALELTAHTGSIYECIIYYNAHVYTNKLVLLLLLQADVRSSDKSRCWIFDRVRIFPYSVDENVESKSFNSIL
jgi:hypothetical protein